LYRGPRSGSAGEAPVRIADEETERKYVILRAEVYDKMRQLLEPDEIAPSCFETGQFEPVDGEPGQVANQR
jgi:hypothetical protein